MSNARFPLDRALQLALTGSAIAIVQREMTWRPEVVDTLFAAYFRGDGARVSNTRLLVREAVNTLAGITGAEALTINFALQIVAAIIGVVATWCFARRWLGENQAMGATLLAAAWMLWGFGHLGWRISYPYDLPAFAFSALGLLAISTRHFKALIICIILGTLNKETLPWLIPAWFFFHRDQRSEGAGTLWKQSFILCVSFLAAYVLPRFPSAHEGDHGLVTASLIDYSAASNVPRIIYNLERLLTFKAVYFIGDLQFVLLLHLLPVLMWQYLPADLRKLYFATPLFVIPMLLAGNIWEVRIFAELLPLTSVALFAAAGIALRTHRSPIA